MCRERGCPWATQGSPVLRLGMPHAVPGQCRGEIVVQLQMHGGVTKLMFNAGSLCHTLTGFKTRKV